MYAAFYSQYLDLPSSDRPERDVVCPFHKDDKPSMSVNVETGLFYCHACGAKGTPSHFFARIKGVSYHEARAVVSKQVDDKAPTIDNDTVLALHAALMDEAGESARAWLHNRGISDETIQLYLLGEHSGRIAIPIFNEAGSVVNIRLHTYTGHTGKTINWRDDTNAKFGSARLYPINQLDNDRILLVEGELDALLAVQNGIPAMTGTGGAKTWKAVWSVLLRDRSVIVCYDTDGTGKTGSASVIKSLIAHGIDARELRLSMVKGKDITDWFGYADNTPAKLVELMDAAEPPDTATDDPVDATVLIKKMALSEAYSATMVNQVVSVDIVVAGKTTEAYAIPNEIVFTCDMDADNCGECPVSSSNGKPIKLSLPKGILMCINTPDNTMRQMLASFCGVKCKQHQMSINSYQTVEELAVLPTPESQDNQSYAIRRAYRLGEGTSPNAAYTAQGVVLPMPRNQVLTMLYSKMEPHQDTLSSFRLTDELKQQLQVFQVEDDLTAAADRLNEIYQDLSENVTGIIGRESVLMAIDLVYHSVISFDFVGKNIRKGWTECLIIGDTRTGKSETATALQRHYGLGEVISGENTSFAGLVGGLQQVGDSRWLVSWGKLPMNDRRLIVVDEVSGLSMNDLANLSQVRSSGIAEITKIQNERVPARTRIVWMSNPRDARSLATYPYGVEAVPDLIGKPEDIARFDFAVACGSADVPIEIINTKRHPQEPRYSSHLCRQLVLWAWTRQHDQVVFTSEAEDLIMAESIVMGKKYSSTIPLVEAADQRIKVARLSAAMAARLFSTPDGETLVVKPVHVKLVVSFLDMVYASRAMQYAAYSSLHADNTATIEQNKAVIDAWIQEHLITAQTINRMQSFTARDLEEMCGMYRHEVAEAIQFMTSMNLIVRGRYGYVKTPKFIELINYAQHNGSPRPLFNARDF